MKRKAFWIMILSAVVFIFFFTRDHEGEEAKSTALSDNPPFGSFETPATGSNLSSSVAFTGWALDDTQLESVKIYLLQNSNLLYIGDAVFVEGARPDVAAAYPNYPNNSKAGWGYMMLTNFLPNKGNGTYTFHVIAKDNTGHEVTLGVNTISIDNAHATKPFGAIDTPLQGETVSGKKMIQGWALTPPPNKINPDGSKIRVILDGKDVGKAAYNVYRPDIATLFPGYENSNGALAYFELDTAKYSNGLHTLGWLVTDNAGNTDGVGSRFFTISNGSTTDRVEKLEGVVTVKFPSGAIPSSTPVALTKTSDSDGDEFFNDTTGIIYEIEKKLAYEVHINTGNSSPEKDIEVTFNIPNDFFTSGSPEYTFLLFAAIYQDGGEEVLDNFNLISSIYNSSTKTLTAQIPSWVFTNQRKSDSRYEALFTIGAISQATDLDSAKILTPSLADHPCGLGISCPLLTGCGPDRVTGKFHEKRKKGLHYGVDFNTNKTSQKVLAAATGVIIHYEIQRYDVEGNYYEGKEGVGYGRNIAIRHADGSVTRYAHLAPPDSELEKKLYVGAKVNRGEQIGISGGAIGSDGSGTTKGPHLHFEFIPKNKDWKEKPNKIDPIPCIGYIPTITETSFRFNEKKSEKFDEENSIVTYVALSDIKMFSIENSDYRMTIDFEASSTGAYECCIPPLISITLSFLKSNKIYEVAIGTIHVTSIDEANETIAGYFEGIGADFYDPNPFKEFILSGTFCIKKNSDDLKNSLRK